MGPEVLAQVLCHLPKFEDERLLVGLETSDDAAVYKLDEEKSIVLTLDFFTPVVDDPYTYGQIAAANSLSDVYAMGGKPVTAMNISCFPNCLEPETVAMILKGGSDKMLEAGVILVGGHTVDDAEPKYGLSVMGFVRNEAIKADLADPELYENSVRVMKYLNKDSGELMNKHGIKGATDITGFGLLGHSAEVAEASGVTLEIDVNSVPILPGVMELAKDGIIPAGRYNNEKHLAGKVHFTGDVTEAMKDILFDPQTSGGLLICVPPERLEDFKVDMALRNQTTWAVIGRVRSSGACLVEVR